MNSRTLIWTVASAILLYLWQGFQFFIVEVEGVRKAEFFAFPESIVPVVISAIILMVIYSALRKIKSDNISSNILLAALGASLAYGIGMYIVAAISPNFSWLLFYALLPWIYNANGVMAFFLPMILVKILK